MIEGYTLGEPDNHTWPDAYDCLDNEEVYRRGDLDDKERGETEDCLNCGQCELCIDRTIAAAEEQEFAELLAFRNQAQAEQKRLTEENARLREGLLMIAQIRHVSGSAQAAFRHNLDIADAVLAGADVRNLDEVVAIGNRQWLPKRK